MTILSTALMYWDTVLKDRYAYRSDLLERKRSDVVAAGFTSEECTVMLTRGWGDGCRDPHLTEERAAAMAQLVLSDTREFISFQSQARADS